jgi:hypothetical protein
LTLNCSPLTQTKKFGGDASMGMSGLPQLTAELDAKEPGVPCVGLIEEIAESLRSEFHEDVGAPTS